MNRAKTFFEMFLFLTVFCTAALRVNGLFFPSENDIPLAVRQVLLVESQFENRTV